MIALSALLSNCGGASVVDTATVEPTPDQPAQATAAVEIRVAPASQPDPGEATREPADEPVGSWMTFKPTPTATAEPVQHVRLSPEQLSEFKPNELGQIPILMYHHIGPDSGQFVRTPEQFRGDLQWLYEHDFQVVNLEDVLANEIDIPAGKRPVVLTFDDSPASQFDLTPLDNGHVAITPDCAVGIMEAFFTAHPDFGRGGHFAVLPWKLFNWHLTDDRTDQSAYGEMKLRWLLDNGYELGNHTLEHTNLATLTDAEIKYQLAEATDYVRSIVPDSPMDIVTLPYGMYPHGGDDTLLRGFEYEGRYYRFVAALLVGANPAHSPNSTGFSPFALARIQANDEQLGQWFEEFETQPGILYVSDGDPTAVTVPLDLHPYLVGTFDETKSGNREVIRY
jgi:peptidoglycan/xylan/chitin deacetylase (PgdA/CDA1 family)